MKLRYIALGLCGAQAVNFSFSLFLSRFVQDKSWEAHWAQSRMYVMERTNYWKFWKPSFLLPPLGNSDRRCLEAWLSVMTVGGGTSPPHHDAPESGIRTSHGRSSVSDGHPESGRRWRKNSKGDVGEAKRIENSDAHPPSSFSATTTPTLVQSHFFFPSMVFQDSMIQLIGFHELHNFHKWWSHCFYAVEPIVRAIRREKQGDAVLLHVKTYSSLICRIPFTSFTFQCFKFPSSTTLVLEDLPVPQATSLLGVLSFPFRLLSHSSPPGVPELPSSASTYSPQHHHQHLPPRHSLWKVWRWKCWMGPTRRVITSAEHHWFDGKIWSAQTGSVETPWGDIGDLSRRSTGYVCSTILGAMYD